MINQREEDAVRREKVLLAQSIFKAWKITLVMYTALSKWKEGYWAEKFRRDYIHLRITNANKLAAFMRKKADFFIKTKDRRNLTYSKMSILLVLRAQQKKVRTQAKDFVGRMFKQTFRGYKLFSIVIRFRYLVNLVKIRFSYTVQSKKRYIADFMTKFDSVMVYAKGRQVVRKSKSLKRAVEKVSDYHFKKRLGGLFFNYRVINHFKKYEKQLLLTEVTNKYPGFSFDVSKLESHLDCQTDSKIHKLYYYQKTELKDLIEKYQKHRETKKNKGMVLKAISKQFFKRTNTSGNHKHRKKKDKNRKGLKKISADKFRYVDQRIEPKGAIKMELKEDDFLAIIFTSLDFGNCLSHYY